MEKFYPDIHGDKFKLRIKKHRDDSGTRVLSISLRPKNGKTPRFYYFNNSKISEFSLEPQEGKGQFKFRYDRRKMSLKEAKFLTLQYLITEYKIC